VLIQALLILAAALLFVLFLRRSQTARLQAFKRIGFLLFCAFGVLAVLRPSVMTWLANRVGVGRGTDLLLYILTVVFGFFALNTYLRFKDTERRLTRLARAMAIRDAIAPDPAAPQTPETPAAPAPASEQDAADSDSDSPGGRGVADETAEGRGVALAQRGRGEGQGV
jgi:small membrane protein